jgi:hypothetical protein
MVALSIASLPVCNPYLNAATRDFLNFVESHPASAIKSIARGVSVSEGIAGKAARLLLSQGKVERSRARPAHVGQPAFLYSLPGRCPVTLLQSYAAPVKVSKPKAGELTALRQRLSDVQAQFNAYTDAQEDRVEALVADIERLSKRAKWADYHEGHTIPALKAEIAKLKAENADLWADMECATAPK